MIEAQNQKVVDSFRTDHLMADLKGRSVRGGVVTMGAQGFRIVLNTGSTMVLARLLTPADFGLIAMVTAIVGFVDMFKDAGLSTATVQREHITHAQVSTLFWINVVLSLAAMTVVTALAPVIAWFYGEPRLCSITLVLAANFIFGGLTVQHQALLRRQMKFTVLAATDILSMVAGIATAIGMAWQGFGYWALVGMTAGKAFANCSLVWAFSKWRPGLPRRGTGVRSMLMFGGNITGFSLINYISRNADNVLIGWWWGAASLGMYSKAYSLLMLPIYQINGPISSVALPALSRLQHQPEKYRTYFCNALTLMSFFSMPLCLFLFASAESMVLLMLGEQWTVLIPIFRALAPAALAGTLNIVTGWVSISLNRTDRQLRWGCVLATCLMGAFLAGIAWGPLGVSVAYSVTYVSLRWPGIMYVISGSHVSSLDIWNSIWKSLCAGAIAALALVLIDCMWLYEYNASVRLFFGFVFYSVLYLMLFLFLPGGLQTIQLLKQTVLKLRVG